MIGRDRRNARVPILPIIRSHNKEANDPDNKNSPETGNELEKRSTEQLLHRDYGITNVASLWITVCIDLLVSWGNPVEKRRYLID